MVEVREYLSKDETLQDCTDLTVTDICELLDLYLSFAGFTFNGTYYKQQYGCTIVLPVSPIVVNMYMELFEQRALESCTEGTGKVTLMIPLWF